ncbi:MULTISPECIES: hypothetical protein [Halomonas]|uniref:hypothetical protein n=1 Tax=Halomonas TaxID=2745 RepID=UPI003CF1BEEB
MDSSALALVFAIVAVTLCFNAVLLGAYVLLAHKAANMETRFSPRRASVPRDNEGSPPTITHTDDADWGLGVLFKEPSLVTNERLALLLSTQQAEYERDSRCFAVPNSASRTPIIVRHIDAQGRLPDFDGNSGDAPIAGVAVVVRKSKTAPSKLQLASVVSLTKEIARMGGTVVDADRQPVSAEGVQQVIAGRSIFS